MQKADALQRFVAAFIDGIVGYLPAWILAFISFKLFFVGYLIAIAYLLTKDAIPATSGFFGGQSVGKKLMKIKVIKEDTGQGIEGDWGASIVRQVSLLIPLFGFVDALMVFGDERKRFGDKWANTIVVKE
ncbi:RDD family protein [Runella sp.]|uniref:RDD family protein n=1 Tax=Runella sp. TaxID=1960881 RepID=UPI003D0F8DD4